MSDQVAKRARMEGGSVNEVQRKYTPPKIICNSSAQKLCEVVHYRTFIDKTLFIKAFLEADDSVMVALAPRRFGKSTNMDMVIEFVKGNKKLFEDNQLKICTEERVFFDKYCQENPVIHMDFRYIRSHTKDGFHQNLRELIHCAFWKHRYLIEKVEEKYSWSDRKLEEMGTIEEFEKYWKRSKDLTLDDAIDGLRALSQCLHVYHEKPVFVFIDEYDSPIMQMNTSSSGVEVLNETLEVINGLMSNLLKGNKHIKKVLINACVRIGDVLPGDLNSIQYYEFLKTPRFSPYFGFTDKEVDSLFERDEFTELKNDQVKEWYNGYTLSHTNEYVIYNCNSVLKYLERSKSFNKPHFKNYWSDSRYITNLKELFAETEILRLIDDLIDGVEVEIETIKKFSKEHIFTLQRLVHQKRNAVTVQEAHLFLQFLTENGYLNVVSTRDKTNTIQAPNNEIKMLLKDKRYCAKLHREDSQLLPEKNSNYVRALESLLQQRDNNAFIRFAKAVSELFDEAAMPRNEVEFRSILFTLAYNVKDFTVKIGRSRPHIDILVIFGNVAMILELKFEDSNSEEAHTEIETQEYETAFANYKDTTEKILVGMHMTKERKVSLTYTVNESSKRTVTSSDYIDC